jgi:hypothetical protein
MESTAEVLAPENTGEKGTVDRSSIKFPYLDQDDSLELAQKIFALGGKSCEKIALATAFNVSADGGGFGLRLATAKMYGFISAEKKMVSLTDLGQRAVDPTTEKAARAESFLVVPLYAALYRDYQGQLLPGNDGLESHIIKLGVAPKQKEKARQVFQRSAKQAGFFSISSNRLAAPQFKPGTAEASQLGSDKLDGGNGGSSGGTGGGDDGNQSLIDGLIKVLPKAGQTWTLEAQRKWLQTAAANFAYAYNGTDETRSIRVTIEND